MMRIPARKGTPMPMNFDYVLTAYGIWILAFGIYIPMIRYKLKRYHQVLETYEQKKSSSSVPERKE